MAGSTVWFMDAGVRCYGEELVAVLSAATAALTDLPAEVHRLTGADLDVVLPVVDALAAVAGAGRYTVTAEAVERGEVAASQAGSTAQWVADRCPTLDARESRAGREGVPRAENLAVRAAAGRCPVGGRAGAAVGVGGVCGRRGAAAAGPVGRTRRRRQRRGRAGGDG